MCLAPAVAVSVAPNAVLLWLVVSSAETAECSRLTVFFLLTFSSSY